VATEAGELEFQSWFVGRGHVDPVLGVRFDGADATSPAPGVLDALAAADHVLIAPSNPFVSIDPILAVPGIRAAVAARRADAAAVSPIVGGRALRGPLAEMLSGLGHEPSAVGVARLYAELVSTFVLDPADESLVPAIEALGLRAVVVPTVMVDPLEREEIGRGVVDALT
jgi:LPPG:FO 2-phospho-L-lactate transferase